MEQFFLDAHHDLLLCVYYTLQTQGVLYVTNNDIATFEKEFSKAYNETFGTNKNFVFSKKSLQYELKANYEVYESNENILPKDSLKKVFLESIQNLDNSKKYIVNRMIPKKLSELGTRHVISMQERKREWFKLLTQQTPTPTELSN